MKSKKIHCVEMGGWATDDGRRRLFLLASKRTNHKKNPPTKLTKFRFEALGFYFSNLWCSRSSDCFGREKFRVAGCRWRGTVYHLDRMEHSSSSIFVSFIILCALGGWEERERERERDRLLSSSSSSVEDVEAIHIGRRRLYFNLITSQPPFSPPAFSSCREYFFPLSLSLTIR